MKVLQNKMKESYNPGPPGFCDLRTALHLHPSTTTCEDQGNSIIISHQVAKSNLDQASWPLMKPTWAALDLPISARRYIFYKIERQFQTCSVVHFCQLSHSPIITFWYFPDFGYIYSVINEITIL